MTPQLVSSGRTTIRLTELFNHHQDIVSKLIAQHGLPLHLFFEEIMAHEVTGYKNIKKNLYQNLNYAFAMKSNPCRGAVRMAERQGMGADVASEFELQAALEEAVLPELITCNGNAKTNYYLHLAASAGALIVVDNIDEWHALDNICTANKLSAQVLLRFRGMPLAGLTADDQSTAADWTKFGFHISEASFLFKLIQDSDKLIFRGISAHIGTQLCSPTGYTRLFECLFSLVEEAQAFGLKVTDLNIGGGFPVAFVDEYQAKEFKERLYQNMTMNSPVGSANTWNGLAYGFSHLKNTQCVEREWLGKAYWTNFPGYTMLEHVLQRPMQNGELPLKKLKDIGKPRLIVEPGRSVMAPSGLTVCEVMGTKTVMEHTVVTLDMGINNHCTNLIAPDIFPAVIWPAQEEDSAVEAFLAGRLCFSGDMISKNKVKLNRLPKRGEHLVIFHTGGYSADHFASHSCGYPRPAKVAVKQDGTSEIWRKRENFNHVFPEL